MSKPATRSCGECVACCVYLRIPELDKGGMERCRHLTVVVGTSYAGPGGCAIYDSKDPERPACCKEYRCAWLDGHGDEQDRPDRSLMLFDRTKRVENGLEAKPLAKGQEESAEGRAVIDRMSRSTSMPVIVLNFHERRVRRIAGRCT